MSRKKALFLSILYLIFYSTTVTASDLPYVPDELLVQFAPKPDGEQCSLSEKTQILNSIGAATIKRIYKIVPGLTLVKLPPGQAVEDALEVFNKTDGILLATPNHKLEYASTFPNDPCFPKLWGLHNTGQSPPGGTPDADIDAPEAWDIYTGSSDIIVAVLDTGVDYNHPDLAANMWHNPGEIPGNGIDDDNNGYVDDIYGYDFGNGDSDPMDYYPHGTMCAGIIGAVGNNTRGLTGVCWNVKIMAVKIGSDYGPPNIDAAIVGIEYAVQMRAKVLNASWGTQTDNQFLRYAIENADANGILFVACAHNYTPYPDLNNDTHPIYPASYDLDNIISVMATDEKDKMVTASNHGWASHYGPNSVDLAAPGTNIWECVPGGSYDSLGGGTSASAPYVAGACALVWSRNPALSYLQVKEIIMNSVDVVPDLNDNQPYGRICVTGGRLNLFNALATMPTLALNKVDDINDGNGVLPGDDIHYTISYANPPVGDPNYTGDVNDVNIIDYLPDDIAPISASGPNSVYHPGTHTVTWNIGPLEPNDSGSVTLTVKVNYCITACGVIANSCRIEGKAKGGTWTRWAQASENTPVCSASNPTPACGELSDFLCTGDPNLNLTWCPGRFAANVNGHEIYFGSNFNDVNDADNSWPLGEVYKGTVTNLFFPIEANKIELGITYYWRIDEVNDSNVWKGSVWSFTTDCYLVENFNSYVTNDALKHVWKDYVYQPPPVTCAQVFTDQTTVRSGLKWDGLSGQSMRYVFKNNTWGEPYYSEARADVNTARPNGLGKTPNWLDLGAKVLSLWFYGTTTNDANKPMYVKLTDGASNSATVNYPPSKMNDIRDEEWHQWNIVLQDFVDDNDVNLANVSRITIGFGNGTQAASDGTVYFEDIRLYLNKRCFPGCYPVGDFEPDCVVDFYDFAILAQAWLTSSGQPDYNPVCDISIPHDGKVDGNDLTRFCDDWLLQAGGETSMGFGFTGAFYTAPPPQQPQIELQPEPEPQPQVQPAPELLQPEPEPPLEPQPQLTEEDIQELVDWLEELWLTDEEVRITCTEAEWLEFIETVRQTPVE